MAWTKYQIFLAFMMLVTGSINTLSTKWADNSIAVGIDDGPPRKFDHPFLQAVGMFMGELSCLLVFYIMRFVSKRRSTPMDVGNQNFNPLIFLPAAMCDMCATSTMYVGLNLTYASSFQMLRGAVIIFTALLSVIFLRRIIKSYMWLGMFGIVCGLIMVGVADIVFGSNDTQDKNGIISGIVQLMLLSNLIIYLFRRRLGEIITAAQMVYEEKFVMKHNIPPLQAVGWEGFFGFTVLGILIVPMYYIKTGKPFSTDPDGRLENALDAFTQMGNNHWIILATLGNIASIAFFNFSGISVTKEMSATTRMVLDSCRTVVIWVFSMAVGWQQFKYSSFLIQAAGFLLLICGMCIYNDIIFAPCLRSNGCLPPADSDLEVLVSNNTVIQDTDDERTPILQNGQEVVSSGPLYS